MTRPPRLALLTAAFAIIAVVTGCDLCLLPCTVCAASAAPQLRAARAVAFPEVAPTFVVASPQQP
jgi:hypothetical protein